MSTWRNFILYLLFLGYCFEPSQPDTHWHQEASQTVQAWSCYSQEWNRWKNRVKWGVCLFFKWKKAHMIIWIRIGTVVFPWCLLPWLKKEKYFHQNIEWFGFEKTVQIIGSNCEHNTTSSTAKPYSEVPCSFITHDVEGNSYSFRLKIGNLDKTLKGCTWKWLVLPWFKIVKLLHLLHYHRIL